eukprot:358517-Chlamydomonas_euryale.AAC.5
MQGMERQSTLSPPPPNTHECPVDCPLGAQLLAECCIGKEPTFVVQASGYLSLADIIGVLLMERRGVTAATLRYVHEAYWLMLRYVYFMTDTENTRKQVQVGMLRMLKGDFRSGQGGLQEGCKQVQVGMLRMLKGYFRSGQGGVQEGCKQ